MNTSNFAKSGNNPNSISIAGKSPDWYKGKEYKELAPRYEFFKKYKEDGDEQYYTNCYYKEILSQFYAEELFEELGENAILLCWESADKFCHRFIVAEWFEKELGIQIKEIMNKES